MAKLIYGFICDEALQKWRDSNGFDPTLIVANLNQGAGVATQNVIEYFNKVAVVKDTRPSRFTNLSGNSTPLFGDLAFLIDQLPPNDEGSTTTEEGSAAVPADVLDIDAITPTTKWDSVFNIIEDCMYCRNKSTSTTTTITDWLNARFQSSTYSGYIPGSIAMSSDADGTITYMAGIGARLSNDVELSHESISLPYWFEFGFNFGIEGYEEVIFRLWVGEKSFLEQYPLTTVTDVIAPCEPSKLATPSNIVVGTDYTVIDAIMDNSKFINKAYKNSFKTTDTNNNTVYTENSGIYIYNIDYFPETYSDKVANFAVVYKGAEPNVELCRKAIKNKLIATGIDEEAWRAAFPGLFTKAIFFIIPMWSNIVTVGKVDGTHPVECGITKWTALLNLVKKVIPTYTESALLQKLEFILHDSTNLIMAVVPGQSNDGNDSLKRMNPTYVPTDATQSAFNYQTDAERTLNITIAAAIASARAGRIINSDDHNALDYAFRNVGTNDSPHSLKFIYFNVNFADYYLLDKSEINKLTVDGE